MTINEVTDDLLITLSFDKYIVYDNPDNELIFYLLTEDLKYSQALSCLITHSESDTLESACTLDQSIYPD